MSKATLRIVLLFIVAFAGCSQKLKPPIFEGPLEAALASHEKECALPFEPIYLLTGEEYLSVEYLSQTLSNLGIVGGSGIDEQDADVVIVVSDEPKKKWIQIQFEHSNCQLSAARVREAESGWIYKEPWSVTVHRDL